MSADPRQLIPQAQLHKPTIGGFWKGRVIAPLPINESGILWIIIKDINPEMKFKVLRWMPRFQIQTVNVAEPADPAHVAGTAEVAHNVLLARRALPVVGSEVLAVFDNRQDIWVVSWW